jgi:hypothetical protein
MEGPLAEQRRIMAEVDRLLSAKSGVRLAILRFFHLSNSFISVIPNWDQLQILRLDCLCWISTGKNSCIQQSG